MGDNFLVSGLIVKYVSVNYIKTFQFKMFYHVISTVKMFYRSTPDDGGRPRYAKFLGPGQTSADKDSDRHRTAFFLKIRTESGQLIEPRQTESGQIDTGEKIRTESE